ncbi:MAG TPA: EAL domain-containing protein, partial [Steroidobacteraceae bacterium]
MTAKGNAAKIATPQVNDVLHRLAELSGASATAAAHAPAAAAEPELALQSDEDFNRALDARAAHEPSSPAANGVGRASSSATWASDSASHARPASKVPAPAAATEPAPRAQATPLTLPDTGATLDDPLDASFIADVRIEPPGDESTVIAPRIDTSDLMLVVQQLLKLRSGGRTRRFEVLLRSRKDPTRDAVPLSLVQSMSAVDSGSIIDRHVLSQLIHWLAGHRAVWEAEPASFSINLATDTLGDAGLLRFAASLLEESKVTPQVLGFEIPERACIERPQETRRFVEDCEKLGCYFVLDDFTMHSSAVPFLASPALRLVKLDAKLTGSALNDKLSQAIVIAISQASKVLGVHCVVKRIDSTMARQWFAAIGIDFAQGFALERPQSLEALALAAAAKSPTH